MVWRDKARVNFLECRPSSKGLSVKWKIYLVYSEVPLEDSDLVQSSLERRVIPRSRDEFEFVLCHFPLDDEFPVKAGEPALVLL